MERNNNTPMDQNTILIWAALLAIVAFITMGCCRVGDIGRFPKGDKGEPGRTPIISVLPATLEQCPAGGMQLSIDGDLQIICNGTDGAIGDTGPQGPIGLPGNDGDDGVGCIIDQLSNGALVTCGANSVVILNGVDGQDGSDGQNAPPTAYSVVEMITLCPTLPGAHKEVLLRLANNQLIAHYASGANQFLSVIGQGNFISTDGRNCNFSVGAPPSYAVSF